MATHCSLPKNNFTDGLGASGFKSDLTIPSVLQMPSILDFRWDTGTFRPRFIAAARAKVSLSGFVSDLHIE
jgi:hypothetical protein